MQQSRVSSVSQLESSWLPHPPNIRERETHTHPLQKNSFPMLPLSTSCVIFQFCQLWYLFFMFICSTRTSDSFPYGVLVFLFIYRVTSGKRKSHPLQRSAWRARDAKRRCCQQSVPHKPIRCGPKRATSTATTTAIHIHI